MIKEIEIENRAEEDSVLVRSPEMEGTEGMVDVIIKSIHTAEEIKITIDPNDITKAYNVLKWETDGSDKEMCECCGEKADKLLITEVYNMLVCTECFTGCAINDALKGEEE